ncbi:hypothetical protein CAEBREN_29524 [Caenorhabditis brenneri]|uniref:Uncharacterized protein n=1 Tax=Caenorhabditis brenneri TaxID=135651 RepID=G0N8B7_CAEBE|nr:hypothetical protein CAEBREN_29524 [Caenorhabditis brenneri]
MKQEKVSKIFLVIYRRFSKAKELLLFLCSQLFENPNEALIESLAPSCLSLEEQQTCFIDTDDSTGNRLKAAHSRKYQ